MFTKKNTQRTPYIVGKKKLQMIVYFLFFFACHLCGGKQQHSVVATSTGTTGGRPNILLLFPDQWRYDWDGRESYDYEDSSNFRGCRDKKSKNEHFTNKVKDDCHDGDEELKMTRTRTGIGKNSHLPPLILPTIQELAQRGTRFLHAYVPSPLCAPARACVASGREYDEADVPTNLNNDYNINIPTFYSVLRDAGNYSTLTTGKDDLTKATSLGTRTGQGDWRGLYHQWELGFTDGFRCSGKIDVVRESEPHERYGTWLKAQSINLQNGTTISGWDGHRLCMRSPENCTAELFPEFLYEDNWVTRNTIRLLRSQGPRHQSYGKDRRTETKLKGSESFNVGSYKDNNYHNTNDYKETNSTTESPWFLQVNFPGPHPPFLVTFHQFEQIENRTFPPAVDNENSKAKTCRLTSNDPLSSYSDPCNYAAECENLDSLIRQILDELKRQGQFDNTIICFSSDHGEMLRDHKSNGKTKPWQGSASVPLICAGPGIRVGVTIDRPVSTMDLAATFLDYANVLTTHRPNGMTSRTLRPLLETGVDENYRSFISSGLQSVPFEKSEGGGGDSLETERKRRFLQGGYDQNQSLTIVRTNNYSWRMVVEADTGLKFICCRGRCPAAPSTAPPYDESYGYHEILFNTTADPFDMLPLNQELPEAVTRLRSLLPSSFGCGVRKKRNISDGDKRSG